MNVLQNTLVGMQRRNPIFVEGVPQFLNVGRYAAKTIYTIDQTMFLYKFGAARQNGRHYNKYLFFLLLLLHLIDLVKYM